MKILKNPQIILGIETSCDETAAAVLQTSVIPAKAGIRDNAGSRLNGRDDTAGIHAEVLSNVIFSQTEIHAKYGGVYPDLAARAHAGKMLAVLDEATSQAGVTLDEIDAVAVTVGPGLIGSLLVGTAAAQTISYAWKKPLYPINHLEGHIYAGLASVNLKSQISNLKINDSKSQKNSSFFILPSAFPLIALIASGGHTQLVLMRDHLRYEIIGQTLDDAAGEAFDKVARIIGLAYPGGPKIEQLAKKGDPTAFAFPRGMIDQKNFNFSFSGLKTAVIYQISKLAGQPLGQKGNIWQDEYDLPATQKADIAASFQAAIVEVLVAKTLRAANRYQVKTIVAGGGVVANQKLRGGLAAACRRAGIKLLLPPPALTTDNAVGIALAGLMHQRYGQPTPWQKIDAISSLKIDEKKNY